MTKHILTGLLFMAVFVLAACYNGPAIPVESPTSGTIHISVDESFRPVIESQLQVFLASFPEIKIIAEYKPEASCLRDLARDSTRMIIVTRPLSLKEEAFYRDTLKQPAISGLLAYDAVALIEQSASSKIPKKKKDSVSRPMMSMDEVKKLLTGKDPEDRQVVMDGISATSTVRYVMDSILKGQPLGKNVMAARTSPEVIDYVAKHDRVVGFVGVSWIGDQEDPAQLAFLEKVNVVALRCDSCSEKPYVEPFQANILLKRYPMVRGLYYMLKENFSGVGNNFVNFLQHERGQLIFRRQFLVPAQMQFVVRDVQLKQ